MDKMTRTKSEKTQRWMNWKGWTTKSASDSLSGVRGPIHTSGATIDNIAINCHAKVPILVIPIVLVCPPL